MNYNWDWGVFFKSTGVGSETYLDWYVTGLGWTIAIAIAAWIIALLLGSVLGVMRTVPNRLVSGIATCYVELFRNVPLLVQLFIWYFLVPDLLPEGLQEWFKQDLNPTTSALISVVICLGLFTAARVCEQVRTGIQALPRGQEAAARAMGFSLPQIYWNVLLPQAYRIIIPPLTSEFLNVFKNSSVASLIGLMELLAQTKQTAEFSANLFEAFTLATLIYFTLNMGLMLLMRMVEKKVAVPGLISVGANNGLQWNHSRPAGPVERHADDPATDGHGGCRRYRAGHHPGLDAAVVEQVAGKHRRYLRQLLPLHPAAAGNHLVLPGGTVRAALDHRRRYPDRAFTSCVVAFMMFEAAYFCEIVRAGVQSISKGQMGAAQALGMTYGQTMRLIILPQAFRKMTPLLLQQSIILFQDTSLVYTVGLVDFLNSARASGDIIGRSNEFLVFAGAVYFVVSFSASWLVKRLQKRITV